MEPPDAFYSTSYIRRMHRWVRLFMAVGIVMTALLVGLATALPFYYASRASVAEISQITAEAQADALHHQLKNYQTVTRQFTSRTEIRQQLAQYAREEISLEQVAAFSAPRLADAMIQGPDIVGLVRLGPSGEEVVRIGVTPEVIEFPQRSISGYPCRFHQLGHGELLLQSCAPIVDAGERIGTDFVFFSADSLLALMDGSQRYGGAAVLRLQESSGIYDLEVNDAEYALTPVDARAAPSAQSVTIFEAPLGEEGWHLAIQVPSRYLNEKPLRLLLLPGLTTLLLAILGTVVFSRAIHPLLKRVGRQAEQLEVSRQELRQAAGVFQHAREAIVITSPAYEILDANPAFSDLLGYPPEQIIGSQLLDLVVHSGTQNTLAQGEALLDDHDSWQGDVHYRCDNGQMLAALQTISAVRSSGGQLKRYIHIFNDISERKAAEEEIHHQALHDGLTGLPNRLRLEQYLAKVLERNRASDALLAVLFLDLDRFKRVNDTLGHQAGDILLQQVSQCLQQSLRAGDMLARLGGDEFIIVLNAVQTPENAGKVAESLVKLLSTPFQIDHNEVTIGASIGIALYPEDGQSAGSLIHAADIAMYSAKNGGRNTWRFYRQVYVART